MFKDSISKIEIVNCDDTGSLVSERFDYQLACAFLTLLTLSTMKEDFSVILERADDFLIVEDLDKTTECISFVQVKTKKDGPYTIRCVVKNEWIKNQAKNYVYFVNDRVKNIFLTNFGIRINNKLIDETSLQKISDLPDCEEKNELITQIEEVLNGYGSLDDFYFLRATLSLDGFREQLKGHLVDYANRTVGGLNSDTIVSVYKTIWDDLHNKQSIVLNEEEKKDYKKIIEKKGIEYARLKEIVGLAKSIQIPEKGDISRFYSEHKFSLGEGNTIVSFLESYNSFRSESPSATHLLEECRRMIAENNYILAKAGSAYEYSEMLNNIFGENAIISDSTFYLNYKYPIIVMFTYKMFME